MQATGALSRLSLLTMIAMGVATASMAQVASTPPGNGAIGDAEILAAALDPAETARRDDLARASSLLDAPLRSDVLAFYAARAHMPYWTVDDRGGALVAVLRQAGMHGLPMRRYDPDALTSALLLAGPDGSPEAEMRAMATYLRFARDLASGVLDPAAVDPEITLSPPRPETTDMLARLGTGSLAQALASLEPPSSEYRALIAEKSRLEAAAALADWGPVVEGSGTLRLGDSGPSVAALRARLAARGFPAPTEIVLEAALDAIPVPGDARFDAGLEAALKRFQSERGLEADGLAGPQTLAAVNEAPDAGVEQVIVNLERLRWMNRDLGQRYIYANIPDYSVQLVEDGRAVYRSRTVVGKSEETRTPEFSDTMTYFVVNPTWHIPDSIAQRVYLPKLKADPNTLANSNMRIFTRSGTEINPGLVDFNQFNKGNFPFRIKQNPSDANALGRVKFMFPNQFSIYLHDTPLRDLFAKEMRAFSNGCVRVENPLELAYLLLEGQIADPAAAFDAWLAAKSERTVNLDRPIPVHLVYRTVFLDEAGAVQRRFDIYGRDAAVFEALEALGVTAAAAQG